MVLAAAGAYACPYASAAGIQTFGEYSGDGGILQSNDYYSIQSTSDIGFTDPGQETLSGIISDGLVSVGRSGTRYNTTIDANDHQVYKGDKSLQYLDGGLSWDAAYIQGSKQPDSSTNSTTVENTTTLQRPYNMMMSVDKITSGSTGMYVSDKLVEQGSNESQDFIELNAQASGRGVFSNDVKTGSDVGFIGTSSDVNFEEMNTQHEKVYGNYTANSTTLLESFSDVYMNPSFNTDNLNLIQPAQMGAL